MRSVSKQVQAWDREALKGLRYVVTDRGLTAGWLKTIGRSEDGTCGHCDEGAFQNSAHLRSCSGHWGWEGRSIDQVHEDMEWCRAVVRALKK